MANNGASAVGAKGRAATKATEATGDRCVSHGQIQADLHQLFSEMQTTFKSVSESVLTKMDMMQNKIQQLERSVASLNAAAVQTLSSTRSQFEGDGDGDGDGDDDNNNVLQSKVISQLNGNDVQY